jgi:hypothetical protein
MYRAKQVRKGWRAPEQLAQGVMLDKPESDGRQRHEVAVHHDEIQNFARNVSRHI